MESIKIRPIGIIRSPHRIPEHTPIQPVYGTGTPGTAELFAEYEHGLLDLDGFSYIWLLYHFHRSKPAELVLKPFLEDKAHGVFATRAPCRPNPIGLSLVRLVRRDGNLLYLEDLDILDETPLLDIKPYVRRFDVREDARYGWQERISDETARRRGSRKTDTAT